MRILSYPLLGLALVATATHAQDIPNAQGVPGSGALPGSAEAGAAVPPDPALPPAAGLPADASVPPATTEVTDSAAFTDAQVDQFAEATVKVQAIDADASIAAEEKQARMATAVTETGLDPATYNEIGRAVAVDAELRSRVQVAMTRHAAIDPAGG